MCIFIIDVDPNVLQRTYSEVFRLSVIEKIIQTNKDDFYFGTRNVPIFDLLMLLLVKSLSEFLG